MAYVELEVVSVDGAPPAERTSRRFEDPGGTIGRDPASSLVLTDRHRRVSRQHARIVIDPAGASIVNESSGLPVMVGSEQLDFGQTARLIDGAILEIGPFVLRATVSAGPVESLAIQEPDRSGLSTAPIPNPDLCSSPLQAQPLDIESLFSGSSCMVAPPSPDPVGSPDVPKIPTIANRREPPGRPVSKMPPRPLVALNGAPADIGGATRSNVPFPDGRGASRPANTTPQEAMPDVASPAADLLDLLQQSASAATFPTDPALTSPYAQPAAPKPIELIPEDFNPFDLPSADRRNPTDPLSDLDDWRGSSGRPASDVIATEPSIDALFLGPGSAGSASPDMDGPRVDPLAALFPERSETDPLAALGVPLPQRVPDRAMADHAQLLNTSVTIPNLTGATPGISAESLAIAARAPSAFDADQAQLLGAFLLGAGIPASSLPQGLTPELMRQVGIMLHAATAGAIDLLAARAATKREVQASVTIISSQANNPLKFLPSPEAALQQMLGGRIPGFLSGDRAVQDAFDDLRAHEVGVIAGTRAALEEILDRFNPDHLADSLSKGSILDNLIPSSRKAHLWDLFVQRYSDIRQEAEDNFHAAFGRAFVEAYEEETKRMRELSAGNPS